MSSDERTLPGCRRPARRLSHHLVLALVIERPSTPDGIFRRYESRFGAFAPELAAVAIPRVLCQLADAGHISSSDDESRPVLCTATGTDAHKQWLLSEIDPADWRRELLARIATGAVLGRDFLWELIGHYRAMAWDDLCRLQSTTRTSIGTAAEAANLARQCVADEQAATRGAQLAWAEDTLNALTGTSTGDPR